MEGPNLRRMTEEVARDPTTWATYRRAVLDAFDRSAGRYELRLDRDHLTPLREAIRRVSEPRRALDLCCGTGVGAEAIARNFPDAWVCGLDLSERMVRAGLDRHGGGWRPVVGDAATLPFADGAFDLVSSVAAPLFATETARVLASRGTVILTFPLAEATPIFLPPSAIERGLRASGLGDIEHGRVGRGTFTVGRKR
jgi:ubiquinone/menaquinone biosynthesis C-methylase UbiE